MDRIKAGGKKYSLQFDKNEWKTIQPIIIADIKKAFRERGYFSPFYNGEYFELFSSFDKRMIDQGPCEAIVDVGDHNVTVCEIDLKEKTNHAMGILNILIRKWKTDFDDRSLKLKPL